MRGASAGALADFSLHVCNGDILFTLKAYYWTSVVLDLNMK